MQYNFKGKHDMATAYVVKDVVSYQPIVNDPIKYYFCLMANTGQTPLVGSDSQYWGLINQLSNFPNSVDSFIFHPNISASDKTNITRFQELTLKTTLTTGEQDELNGLTQSLRNKLILAEDINALQDSISNMQLFFKDGIEAYVTTAQTDILNSKDSALLAIETKKNNIIAYLDGTTAGQLRNDIGIMGDLTTTDVSSLVNALNEVNVKSNNHIADNTVHTAYVAATGVANAYEVTLSPVPTAYVEGMAIAVKINVANTGASTININSLGVKAIKKTNGNDVLSGNLKAGNIYDLRYDGVNFVLRGGGGTAEEIEIVDAGNYYISVNTEGALQEIGQVINGLNGNIISGVNSIAQG